MSVKNINEITIRRLQSMYQKKEISVTELVQEYINRIITYDQSKLGCNSVLEINPEALDIAKKLEKSKQDQKLPLYGVPILIKDNIATADQMHTSGGAMALADSIPSNDADIIKLLREKGAIILGKANQTELANYMTEGMPAGYSSKGGYVTSPYVRSEDPSGSSTGSAVAVTTNLCVAALGTDTAGSIIYPSSANSIVGYRPSIGMMSQKGIMPISFTLDTAGTMTRTVEDGIIITQALTGENIDLDLDFVNGICNGKAICNEKGICNGKAIYNGKGSSINAKNHHENSMGLQGVRIGIDVNELEELEKEIVIKVEEVIHELKKAGAIITEITQKRIPKDWISVIQKYEFKYSMNQYLATLPKEYPIRTLQDIIDFNLAHKKEALIYGQSKLEGAQDNTRGDLSEEPYIRELARREQAKVNYYGGWKNLDLMIHFKTCLNATYLGLPSLTIPYGLKSNGMPYGIQLLARLDSVLLRQGLLIDNLLGNRVVPVTPHTPPSRNNH